MASIISAIVLCVIIPYIIIAMLFPQLAKHAPSQRNYLGASVITGLGIVWVIWLAMIWIGSVVFKFLEISLPTWMSIILDAFPLLMGTCAFGLFDDWAGDCTSKGFKGHFLELSRGHLTTGMLKLIGIGLLSLATGLMLYDPFDPARLTRIICAALTIALFANFSNLMDLRPLRASKVYIFSIVICIIALVISKMIECSALEILSTSLACLGPVLATWSLDRKEIAMLGDAGANTMGALVGFLLSISLPIWLLVPLTLVLLAINLLSERVSFTKVIERIPPLHAIDMAFRKDYKDHKS